MVAAGQVEEARTCVFSLALLGSRVLIGGERKRMLKGEYRDLDLSKAQVFLIDMGHSVLSTFSPASQAYAAKMLEKHGVQMRLGAAVKEVTSDGVLLSDGTKIASRTVIWAGGLKASSLVAQIRSLTGSITELEELIQEEGPKLAGHENLMSIKGIGPVSATVLLSVIGDIADFSDAGKLAAYLGLVPKVQNSNETERSGHITKQGNKLARTALVQCALIAKRYSSYLQNFYQRIQRRRGGGKANIALARKFLGVIYHTLKNNWVFADFPNFILAS